MGLREKGLREDSSCAWQGGDAVEETMKRERG